MPVRIAVSGASGRMGRELAALIAEAPDLEAVGGIVREGHPTDPPALGYPRLAVPEAAATVIESADVVIDFSAPEFLARVLEAQGARLVGRAVIVGTTGLDEPVHRLLDASAMHGPVLTASNFSVGVNVLLALVEEAARLLSAERYDAEIVEAHHRDKADAPSGTALSLARTIAHARGVRVDAVRRDGRSGRTGARPAGEIGIHAIRGGSVVGEHRVQFLGRSERIELAHVATDRALFAEGALLAARWIAGRSPGRYTMRDVMEG